MTSTNSEAGLQAPGVQVNGLNGQINAPSLTGGISAPTVNAVKTPNFSHQGFKKPTFGLSAPNLQGACLDGTLEAPDVSLSTPTLNTPDVSLNVDKPELKPKCPSSKCPPSIYMVKKQRLLVI